MWDNAYAVHHLEDQEDRLANLFTLSANEGTQDDIAIFGSTSKITFAGAGVGFCALSDANLTRFERFMGEQMIGFDKVNQLKHAQFLSSPEKLASHMRAHRRILEPKFAEVYAALAPLAAAGLVEFTAPRGGYFVSVDLKRASAQAVVRLAAEAGVKLTPAGATYPYGQDPHDANLRIAPSFPKTEVLKQAMEVFACCVRLASLD
jgi:DNA-binding transcriptional MocR family regulator